MPPIWPRSGWPGTRPGWDWIMAPGLFWRQDWSLWQSDWPGCCTGWSIRRQKPEFPGIFGPRKRPWALAIPPPSPYKPAISHARVAFGGYSAVAVRCLLKGITRASGQPVKETELMALPEF